MKSCKNCFWEINECWNYKDLICPNYHGEQLPPPEDWEDAYTDHDKKYTDIAKEFSSDSTCSDDLKKLIKDVMWTMDTFQDKDPVVLMVGLLTQLYEAQQENKGCSCKK